MIQEPDRWARIQELFHQALDVPGPERDEWLLERCGRDLPLWREVVTLLAADAPQGDVIAAAMVDAAAPALPRLEGRRVGPYRIIEELGHGGMGTVYLAERDGIDFQQRVAIKLLRGFGGADKAARLRSERRILAALEHPNIARLLDGGSTPEGLPYFVMEYVAGVAIDAYCRSNDRSIEERLRLFVQVCDAVDHAHVSLIVHRDIKPSNILVTADGTPKLLDFGIAKLLDPETQTGEPAPVTGTFVRLFSRDYASPEQVRGEAITTATDTYALGVLLYELLSGMRPFRFTSERLEDIERVIESATPLRPSIAARENDTRRARALAGDLDTIVMTAMDKDPRRRYASAGRLADDVRRYLDKRPILARPTTWTYRTGRFVIRHRLAVAAASVFAALLIGGAGAFGLQAQRVQRERDTAEQVVSFLIELFTVADPSESRGNSVTAREILDRGAARIETELTAQPVVQARMLDAMGGVYRSLGLYERAQTLLEHALGVRESIDGRRSLEAAVSMARLAETLRERSRPAEAEPLAREALEIRRELAGPRAAVVAQSLNSLGLVLQSRGKPDEALQLFEEALAIWRERGRGEAAEAATVHNSIATIYRDRQDYQNGEAAGREALRIRRAVLAPDHPHLANTITVLGQILDARGHDTDAEVLLREARALRERSYGPDHPLTTQAVNNLASVIHDQGRYADAGQLYRLALEKNRARLGDHLDTAMNLNNLGSLMEDSGRFDEAAKYFLESLDMRRRLFGPNHLVVARTMNNYARLLTATRRPAEALPLFDEVLRIRLLTQQPDHIDVLTVRVNRAVTLSQLGRQADADREFPSVIAVIRQKIPPGNIYISSPLAAYARHLFNTGRAAEALPLAEESRDLREKSMPASHWLVGQINGLIGAVLVEQGRAGEGIPLLERARDVMTRALPPGDSRVAEIERWLGAAKRG